MSATDYIGAVVALGMTSVLILWLHPIARAIGLVDVPDGRKVHDSATPLVGGPAIFLAVFAAHILSGFFLPHKIYPIDYYGFYLAGVFLVLTGMIDDYRPLSPSLRLAVEAAAALVMIFVAGVVLSNLGELWIYGQPIMLGLFAAPITVFAALALVNAINMSDGLDGLAGTLILVTLLGFIVATTFFGSGLDLRVLVVLAAGVFGFLMFNARWFGRDTAVVFLGDSGTMFLGFALCWFAIRFTQGDSRIMPPAAVLWFVMVPLFDAACVTARRLFKRRPPFGADKEHLHHIFLLAGFSVGETTLILGGMALAGVVIGLSFTYFQVPEPFIMGSFLLLGLAYLWTIVRSWQFMRFLRRSICRRRAANDRRSHVERRQNTTVAYFGPERRSGADRREDPRRSDDAESDEQEDEQRKSA